MPWYSILWLYSAGSCFVCWFNGTQMCVCVFTCLKANLIDEWVTFCPTWKYLAQRKDRVWLGVCSELGQLVNDCSICVQADTTYNINTSKRTQNKGRKTKHVPRVTLLRVISMSRTSVQLTPLPFLVMFYYFCAFFFSCSNTSLQCSLTSCNSLI